ncbi:nucleotide sugar dehydrogenase [Hydrotalea sp.]|uniref:nucleotide sugar dehydrogenase n=2 Tax=Hydrotalea sp. TaxID=2881279 RepID=UPI0026245239|nr:nucleotide sugar dehydrogenase [Hydrotalea sp.]
MQQKEKVAIIGLGYVGLSLALAFAKKKSVIGFDINATKVQLLQNKIDPNHEFDANAFNDIDAQFTSTVNDIQGVDYYIVAVPTPVNGERIPNLTPLLQACKSVAAVIDKGSMVIFESTVYPGCTEEDCIPLIEQVSGLKAGTDFLYGYSPERINPGDAQHTLEQVVKVVSGCNEYATAKIAELYAAVVQAGIHIAPTIKTAEAAKIIENTQRDLNIGLMNELSMIFDKMQLNTKAVLAAAATKWNFIPFMPGLVGGHCIGVDPYYLTYKAAKLGYNSQIITAARMINDGMGKYIADKIIQHLIVAVDVVKNAKVLVMGTTFKENVADIRNAKIADVIFALQQLHIQVHVTDPRADNAALQKEYGYGLVTQPESNYDVVVIAVPHQEYLHLNDTYFAAITQPHALIVDVKGIYANHIYSRKYWSL